MSQRDDLASRISTLVALDPRITEKKMFGGVAFLLNGHILVSARRTGTLLVQTGRGAAVAVAGQPGVAMMFMRGKQAHNFIDVDDDRLETDDDLQHWLSLAEKYVSTLPQKQ